MMSYDEVRKQPRADVALMNVFSYMAMHPFTVIQKIENEPMEKVFCIRVFYRDCRSGKSPIVSFNFYRSTEAQEADTFINTLCDVFHISATGDPVF